MIDQLRPFDGQALSYTLREINPGGEYQSQYVNADAAACAFIDACADAHSVELRGPDGDIVAAFARGRS